MEIFVFLIIVLLLLLIAVAIGEAASTTTGGNSRPTEKTVRDIGQQTRVKIDSATQMHKQQTFDHLYQKHQESIKETLHD